MRKILLLLFALVFLSGCALTTIRPYKKPIKAKPKPVKKTLIERVKKIVKPQPPKPKPKPKPAVVKKRPEEKEEILQTEEEDIK